MAVRGWLAVVVLLAVAVAVEGTVVDIKPYYSLILEKHNQLRASLTPNAADMKEMMWDAGLARDAEAWSRQCQYQRPPRHVYQCGANLFYDRRYVRSWHSIRSHVKQALRSWERGRQHYQYSTNCGSSCSYVQMIYSASYKVGCAMNTCSQLRVGSAVEAASTLFICFYAPRGRLSSTYPYRSGASCSQCPENTRCSGTLCKEGDGIVGPGEAPKAIIVPDSARVTPAPPRAVMAPPPPGMSTGPLSHREASILLQAQNMYRQKDGCPDLQWDHKLQKWTDWIVNCKTDYPGPSHAYTSFARCSERMPVHNIVYGWHQEGTNTAIVLDKGCRTPYDRTPCNHFTNMLQPRITSMACSACNCGDGTRQLVCVYDNMVERQFRGYGR